MMFQVNNKNYLVLVKFKEFMILLDKTLENVPRKDMFYKD